MWGNLERIILLQLYYFKVGTSVMLDMQIEVYLMKMKHSQNDFSFFCKFYFTLSSKNWCKV